jgi:hypothetical protein
MQRFNYKPVSAKVQLLCIYYRVNVNALAATCYYPVHARKRLSLPGVHYAHSGKAFV